MGVTHETEAAAQHTGSNHKQTVSVLRSVKMRRMNLRRPAASLERGLIPDAAKY